MSGIAGIVEFGAAPVDQSLVERLTLAMRFRGPDYCSSVCAGTAGLGFTQLTTTDEDQGKTQPISFEGRVFIVADARIDGRSDLISELRRAERRVAPGAPDGELILHAYHAWGQDCVDRLIGDFAFAVWDSKRERLFCARDQFGVKPFFYADLGDTFVFSNTLNVVRLHPDVSEALNELAVADFLMFGFNQELDTTAFRDIRRLPPAHVLALARGKPTRVSRYWSLPVDGAVRYRRQSDYVEHFKELFCLAVTDRLRSQRVGIAMSGGLDSTSVASTAHDVAETRMPGTDIRLCTNVYDRLISDEERNYARQVADQLGLPIHFEAADDAQLHAGWHKPGLVLPEPVESFDSGSDSEAQREFVDGCRVMLSGFGGDPALAPPRDYVLNRVLRGEFLELAGGLWSCARTHGRMPSIGIRTLLLDRRGSKQATLRMPAWLNRELVTSLDLETRWRQHLAPAKPKHPVRPEAYGALTESAWPYAFGIFDPGSNTVPVEHRHPFFDRRLIEYVLAMPRQPWFERKALLREAMKGMLPESVRLRPKTFLSGDPRHAVSPDFDRRCRENLLSAPDLSLFVDKNAIPVHIWEEPALTSGDIYGNVRAFGLGYWLRYCRQVSV